MLAYNIWRYMKMLAQKSVSAASKKLGVMKGIVANTVRIARLKLLFIAAKVVQDGIETKSSTRFTMLEPRRCFPFSVF
jgi:hypothetical protein